MLTYNEYLKGYSKVSVMMVHFTQILNTIVFQNDYVNF